MKAILRSINNFSCKLKQSNNLKYNISPKMRSNKFKSISGNGNVTIEDALNKALKDYKVYGNTYQNITSGKNKYGITSAEARNYGNSLPTGTTTNIVIDNYDLNSVKFHSVAKGNYLIALLSTQQLEPNTDYILSYTRTNRLSSGSDARRYLYAVDENDTYSVLKSVTTGDEGNKSVQFTTSSSGKIALAFGYLNNSSANESEVTNIMIRMANVSNDSFEPYTGGQPSPNPDYPQEIVSCGDRTKNLFIVPQTIPNAQRNLATYTKINDNSFSLNYIQNDSTNKAPYVRIDFDITQFKPNTQYTISKKHNIEGISFNNIGALRTYINGSNGSVVTSDSLTFTTPNEITSLGVYFYLGYNNTIQGESTITFYDVQVEENSTATSYEPYGYKIPVNVRSENLISETVYQTNTILNTSGEMVSNNNYFVMKQTNIKPLSKYILSENQNYNVSSGTSVRVCAYDENDNFISFLVNNTRAEVKRYSDEFVIPTNTDYILISFRNSDTNIELVESIDTNIYLDEPLRKIEDYSDYIDFINGKVVRNINETVLNGSETWNKIGTISNHFMYFYSTLLDATAIKNLVKIMFSNKFKVYEGQLKYNVPVNTDSINISNNDDTQRLRILISETRLPSYTTDNFKSWLQSNNVTVDYVLSTPTEEDIELPNINLIEGKNIITIGTELQGVFEVEYYSKEIIDISNYKYNLRKVED